MKDARFNELLNLYIDRQISPAEAAELETEIRANAHRRRAYRQYCQMHRATKLVYESFRAADGSATAPARQPGSIATIESIRQRQKIRRWTYAGGLAAAACVTLVVARFNPVSKVEESAPVQVAETKLEAPAVDPMSIRSTAQAPAREITPAGILNLSSGIVNETDYAAAMAAYREEERRLAALTQQPNGVVRPRSLFDDGVFDGRAEVLPGQNARNNQRQRTDRVPTEFTAFQFRR